MDIKVKKRNGYNVERIQGTADIKEFFSNTDFMHPEKAKIQVCFSGEHCSGIIELSREEAKSISKNITRLTSIGKKIKVIRLKE